MSGGATSMERASKGPMTMADLARLAGVSASTVSRALAGNPAIHADTRARILALARAHGFSPNGLARSLRTGRTGAVGIMLPEHMPADPEAAGSVAAMIGALAEAAAEAGHDVVMWREPPAEVDRRGEGRSDQAVDGGASAARTGRADAIVVVGDAAVPPGRQPILHWVPDAGLMADAASDTAPIDRVARALVDDLLGRLARGETRPA